MNGRADLEAALEAVLFAAAQPVPVERLSADSLETELGFVRHPSASNSVNLS